MTKLNIAVIYFSATNVTDTYARAIDERLRQKGCSTKVLNITSLQSRREKISFEGLDAVIFGFPVFADFAPRPINDWFAEIEGKGLKCATFFTYGARTAGYAHFHTKKELEKAGFKVMLSAEFPGRHTFNICGWKILPNRPDAEDLKLAGEFIDTTLEYFTEPNSRDFILQKPFGYEAALQAVKNKPAAAERSWTNPVRTKNECRMCRRCEKECPTGAMNADSGLSDPSICIGCMRCVIICPERALQADERMEAAYNNFKRDHYLSEEMMEQKRGKIITNFLQAAI